MNRNGFLALLFNALFVIFIMAPLVIVIWMSFTPGNFLTTIPVRELSLRWYRAILDSRQFLEAFWLSARLATFAATAAVALAVPAALAIARYEFPGRTVLIGIFLSPLLIPQVVLGVAFLRLFTQTGITGSLIALVGSHILVIFPYALRLILASLTSRDLALERAALSLGASNWTVFRRVVLPAMVPGIAGGWLISFIQSFDEVTMTVFIATPSTITLPVWMYHYIEESIDPLIASVSTVIIVLTYLVMFVIDRIYGLDRVLVGRG